MPVAVVNGKVILFAHVPKTGGSSVERYFIECGVLLLKNSRAPNGFSCNLQHLHAEPLSAIIEVEKLDYSFMITRHPVARIASEYRYQMRKKNWLRDRLGFSQWLAYAMARRALNPWHRDNHFRPQYEFELPGMEIFRFEHGIDACIKFVAERLDLPVSAQSIRENSSPVCHFRFTADDLTLIERVYAQDLKSYQYGMERADLLEAGIAEHMLPQKTKMNVIRECTHQKVNRRL